MVDQKITALTADATPTGDDLVVTVNDPGGTPANRKVTVTQLATALAGLSAFTSAFAPLAGPYVKDYARATRTAGNLTINSTSWANVDTGTDLVLTAATGDVIEVGISARVTAGAANTDTAFDVATIVSASPVNYFATAGGASDHGVIGWLAKDTQDTRFGSTITRTLVSGDISGGTVTLRLRYRQDTAGNRLFVGTATDPFIWYAKNLGPAT